MAIQVTHPVADDPAVKLAENTQFGGSSDLFAQSFLLKNVTGTASVFLGPSGVDETTGFEWAAADGPMSIDLEPGESIYGHAATEQTIHVLKGGR